MYERRERVGNTNQNRLLSDQSDRRRERREGIVSFRVEPARDEEVGGRPGKVLVKFEVGHNLI